VIDSRQDASGAALLDYLDGKQVHSSGTASASVTARFLLGAPGSSPVPLGNDRRVIAAGREGRASGRRCPSRNPG